MVQAIAGNRDFHTELKAYALEHKAVRGAADLYQKWWGPEAVVVEKAGEEPPREPEPVAPAPVIEVDPEEPGDRSYSKFAVAALFLATIPVFVLWAALLVVALPLRLISVWAPMEKVDALYGEFFSILGLLPHYFSSEKYQFTPGEGRPILLVHGYLHNASGWYALIERLKNEGIGPIYSIDLGEEGLDGKFWSIRDYAKQVKLKTEEIARETGRRDIALIGHSMGGVVCSLASPESVTDVITIGSPLRGAPVAKYFGIGSDGEEMRPGSALLEKTRVKIAETARIHYRHIGSKADQLIPSDSSLMGVESVDNILFRDLGHVQLMVSERVGDKLVAWLKA